TNKGPGDASGVVVTDPLPAGLAFVSADPAPGTSYDPSSGTWTVGNLAVGASTTLTITATVLGVTPETNVARVSAVGPEPDLTNNTSPVTVTLQEADLALVKQASPTRVMSGHKVTYTFILHNNGPTAATDVVVSDPFPSGVALGGPFIPSQGTFDPATG